MAVSNSFSMRVFRPVTLLLLVAATCSLLRQSAAEVRCYDVSYATIARSGKVYGKGTFGHLMDINGQGIVRPLSINETWTTPLRPEVFTARGKWTKDSSLADMNSNSPDIPTIHEVGGNVYMISHFEYPQPSTAYITRLAIGKDGTLTAANTSPVDDTDPRVQGLWFMCRGEKTPWGTHIGAEEYPPDCREYEEWLLPCPGGSDNLCSYEESASAAYIREFARYYGFYSGIKNNTAMAFAASPENFQAFKKKFSCYNYGSIVEISVVDAAGATKVIKWRTMGRVSGETAMIMPDNKTIYTTDDMDNGVLLKFVADKSSELSSGTLYAAEFKSKPGKADEFTVNWIKLGQGDQTQLEALARNPAFRFSTMFEVANVTSEGKCPEGFLAANKVTPLGLQKVKGKDLYVECLKVKPGQHTAAAFFETGRYATMKGATTEFQKMEGLAFAPDRKEMYMALARVSKGMLAGNKLDGLAADHLSMEENPCGVVMGLDLDESYNIYGAKVTLAGNNKTNTDKLNTCDKNAIAGPDNLFYMNGNLLVAEDTSAHLNNVLWAYNFKTGKLSRVLSSPKYAEVSGQSLSFAGGRAYITLAMQHPETEEDDSEPADATQAEAFRGYVGYIGPLPLEAVAPEKTLYFEEGPLKQPAQGDDTSRVLSTMQICSASNN